MPDRTDYLPDPAEEMTAAWEQAMAEDGLWAAPGRWRATRPTTVPGSVPDTEPRRAAA
ncbi:hypothetical protein ACWEFL_02585 [Streptomyces sp. NPDC004838]